MIKYGNARAPNKKISKRILLVEHDQRAASFAKVLDMHGYEINLVDNLADAADELKENGDEFAAVIMDFALDGRDLENHLRKKMLDEGIMPGWLFYQEVIAKNYPELAENTLFFADDSNIESVRYASPEWYEKHLPRLVSMTDSTYKERILGFLDSDTRDSIALYDYENAKEEILRQITNDADIARLNDYIAGISHEIRTPLSAIIGFSDDLLEKRAVQRDSNIRYRIGAIYDSAHYLKNLANGLLDAYKNVLGNLELLNAPYNIEYLIRDAVNQNMIRLVGKPVNFDCKVDETIPSLLVGDEHRILRILNNILSNAMKYTDRGSVTLNVWAETGITAKTVNLHFTVEDTGKGMTQKEKEEYGIRFSCASKKAGGNIDSVGIGTTLISEILHLMGGRMSQFNSELDKGTTITVVIPQGIADSKPLGKEKAESLKNFNISGYRKKPLKMGPMPYGSVLVVDDEPNMLIVTEDLLMPYKLKIIDKAECGNEAINKIKVKIEAGDKYDIVFMDHRMYGLDGVETTQIIRKLGYNHPIVALTANATKAHEKTFLENGFCGFISKPIEKRELDRVLREYILNLQPHDQLEEYEKLSVESCDSTLLSNESIIMLVDEAERLIHRLKTIDLCYSIMDSDLREYTRHIHVLKTILSHMDEWTLSEVAQWIEHEGENRNKHAFLAVMPSFLDAAGMAVDKYKMKFAYISQDETKIDCYDEGEDIAFLRYRLLVISEAYMSYETSKAENTLKEVDGKQCSYRTRKILKQIYNHAINGEYEKAAEVCKKYYEELGGAPLSKS